MPRLLFKSILLLLPFLGLAAFYLWLDPFCICWSYPSFQGQSLRPDRGYLSCQFYERRRSRCNAFIFGNSRALGIRSQDWQRHLPAGTAPFHFASTNDSLLGIERKVAYVSQPRHVLLVFDHASLAAVRDGQYGTPRLPSALLSTTPPWRYQLNAARSYFSCYSLGHLAESGWKLWPTQHEVSYHPETNDIQLDLLEAELRSDPAGYYARRASELTPRQEVLWGPVLGTPEHLGLLQSIQHRLSREGSDYRVLLAPTYDRVRLNRADLEQLQRVFGKHRVHDFSGDHPLARDPRLWYEPFHFRPECGQIILQEVYP